MVTGPNTTIKCTTYLCTSIQCIKLNGFTNMKLVFVYFIVIVSRGDGLCQNNNAYVEATTEAVWSDWNITVACSATCGKATKVLTRMCIEGCQEKQAIQTRVQACDLDQHCPG